jgi:GT2 family glycosyltransferase
MKVLVVVPNWNGKDSLRACLDSLLAQTLKPHIVVVDNGSTDGSVEFIRQYYPNIELIEHQRNLGYAGGVNPGLREALQTSASYVAPFNNDAVADKDWLKFLIEYMEANPEAGIAACKLLSGEGSYLDSTGDYYTAWGLPYPRGRLETDITKYDESTEIFSASGGASLYRVVMLNEIGLFDEDFFAYYEDVDLSFRAQLAGWKVAYVPRAIAYHQIGATSDKIKGFTAYQTMKNLPWLLWKNVPLQLLPAILPRFTLAHTAFFFSAVQRGHGWPALKGVLVSMGLFPKKLIQRHSIQKNRKVTVDYTRSILTYDLPPNAFRLRALRTKWHKLTGKQI